MRAPIGEMVIAFNRMEENAHFVLWRLSDAPPGVAQALCSGLSFAQVLERLLALADVVNVRKDLQNQLRDIVSEARMLNQERNKFVHASWINFGDEGLHRTRIRADCFQLDKIARTEVRALALKIKACDRKLHEWSNSWRPFARYRMRTPDEIAAYDAANSDKSRGATS